MFVQIHNFLHVFKNVNKINPRPPTLFLSPWSPYCFCTMCRSTNCLGICTIMYYMQLIWMPWQQCATMCMVNFVNKLKAVKKKDTPSSISTILITCRHILYVFVDLQLLSSKLPFYLKFG